jgi:transposase
MGQAADYLLDRKWLHEHYIVLNMSTRQIGNMIGCGKKAVSTALKRFNIPLGTIGSKSDNADLRAREFKRQAPLEAHGKLDNCEWLHNAYLVENRSKSEIAESVGVNITTVKAWIDRFGLVKSEAKQLECSHRRYREINGFDIKSDQACRKRMTGRRGRRVSTVKGGDIWCHSSWEETTAKFLDISDGVKSFGKDVISIPYSFNGKNLRYYPDFLVNTTTGVVIIEVKADKLQREDKSRCKLDALQDFCDKMGYRCVVVGGKNKLRLTDIKW